MIVTYEIVRGLVGDGESEVENEEEKEIANEQDCSRSFPPRVFFIVAEHTGDCDL